MNSTIRKYVSTDQDFQPFSFPIVKRPVLFQIRLLPLKIQSCANFSTRSMHYGIIVKMKSSWNERANSELNSPTSYKIILQRGKTINFL